MLNVRNGKSIRKLAWKTLRASKTRNLVAVLSIMLTALLFTALFTIAMSINATYQESNFRQAGGYNHGTFKRLTQEQYDELRTDPLIKAYGLHRPLGVAVDDSFSKTAVELHHYDSNAAQWGYCQPTAGRLPAENTDEAATDLYVLRLMGIEPRIGEKMTVTVDKAGRESAQTFTLCGWWESDDAAPAHMIVIPNSRVDQVLGELGFMPPYGNTGDDVGTSQMEIMLAGSHHIETDMKRILERHGYQCEDASQDNYISIGVNWGYTGAQLAASEDTILIYAVLALLLGLILLTEYLVIYNVFRISVANDIRHYGLLKTLGTTGPQIRRMIRWQVLALCAAGTPAGLLIGWLTGGLLIPLAFQGSDLLNAPMISGKPVIFLGAALFTLGTTLISCSRPGQIAGRVSPVEAIRYTEAGGQHKKARTGGHVSPFTMALANLERSRGKTALTILSLALGAALLCITVFLAGGFDMNRFLRDKAVCDYILAENKYFHSYSLDKGSIPEGVIATVNAQEGIVDGGREWMRNLFVEEFVQEEHIIQWWKQQFPLAAEEMLKQGESVEDGKLSVRCKITGMEDFLLNHVTVAEGDLSPLYEPGGHYIAAVAYEDDYGNIMKDSVWANVGDTVTIRFVDEYEFYDTETGRIYTDEDENWGESWAQRAVQYKDVEFQVAAVVTYPQTLSSRFGGYDEFILNSRTFLENAGATEPMLYAFNTTDEANGAIGAFLSDYTNRVEPAYNYESRETYRSQFESVRFLFLLWGGALSFIVGLVGLLNFVNAVITSITSRRRELAMLQAVGMTGRQLKMMLIWEGLFYTVSSTILAMAFSVTLEFLSGKTVASAIWFFAPRLILWPVAVTVPVFTALGILIPVVVYGLVSRYSVVERLRLVEE